MTTEAPIGNTLGDPIFSYSLRNLLVMIIVGLVVRGAETVSGWVKKYWPVLLAAIGVAAAIILFRFLTGHFSPTCFQ